MTQPAAILPWSKTIFWVFFPKEPIRMILNWPRELGHQLHNSSNYVAVKMELFTQRKQICE